MYMPTSDRRARAIVNAPIFLMILGWLGSSASIASDMPDVPVIHIEDVAAFYKLYDATHGHPTAEQKQ
jgi:hypothetical protein